MGLFSWLEGPTGQYCGYCKRNIDNNCINCGIPLCKNHTRTLMFEDKKWFGLISETKHLPVCQKCYQDSLSY